MKTKHVFFMGAIILLATGTASNFQWSINKYGLLSGSLSKQVLALSSNDTSDGKDGDTDDTGKNEKKYKEKKYQGEKRALTTSTSTTKTVGVNIGVIKGETTTVKTTTETTYQYLNECVGEGDLKNCISSWDSTPAR